MAAIQRVQSGADWWVDGYASFAGGQLGNRIQGGAMFETSNWGSYAADSFVSEVLGTGSVAAVAMTLESKQRQFQDSRGFAQDEPQLTTGKHTVDSASESFAQSIQDDARQNPASAFAATTPTENRLGILGLLT